MKKYILMILLAAAVFFAGCRDSQDGPADGAALEKVFQRGPFEVRLVASSAKINIAQTLVLDIIASADKKYRPAFAAAEEITGKFDIIETKQLPQRLGDEGEVVSGVSFVLEPAETGTLEVPQMSVKFYDANSSSGKFNEVLTEPVEIEVAAVIADADANTPIADVEGVVGIGRNWGLIISLIAAFALAIAGGIVWLLVRKSHQVAVQQRIYKSAHRIAKDAIEKLMQENPAAQGRVKEFYEKLTCIIRGYIENRFDINAPEKTTEEFLAQARGEKVFEDADRQMLAEFLTHCDLVKFARYQPSEDQRVKSTNLASDFVEKTKSEDKLVDVTDSGDSRGGVS
ncbi:MAG: hypothetical protein K8R02_06740 [Anaerohalosphaeraceae bacterium]|nr:hypothetical protein [Anaerohalosphaeraceae bacterium]